MRSCFQSPGQGHQLRHGHDGRKTIERAVPHREEEVGLRGGRRGHCSTGEKNQKDRR